MRSFSSIFLHILNQPKVRKEVSGGRLERYFSGQKDIHTAQVLLRRISYSYEYVFEFLLGLVPTSGETLHS
jgi:hypothetical protein